MPNDALAQRLDRVESELRIRNIVAEYAFAIDGRDLDAIASLYVPDVKVGAPVHGSGREALKEWFMSGASYWYRSMHQLGAHVVVFDDDDHAHGSLQCRVEQEIGDQWVITVVNYGDTYVRVDGEWLFGHRRPLPLYSAAFPERPNAQAFVATWGPGGPASGAPVRVPASYPTFAEFWGHFSDEDVAKLTSWPIASD